jgi:hypothetical protein
MDEASRDLFIISSTLVCVYVCVCDGLVLIYLFALFFQIGSCAFTQGWPQTTIPTASQ